MKVKKIMSKHPDALSDEMTLQKAAEEMKKHDFGFLPVKHDQEIVGVVTDRDLVIRCVAEGQDPTQTKIKEVMTNDIHICHEDDDLEDAINLMCEKQIHRLAVVDENNHLSGILSVGDIAKKNKDINLLGKLIEAIHC